MVSQAWPCPHLPMPLPDILPTALLACNALGQQHKLSYWYRRYCVVATCQYAAANYHLPPLVNYNCSGDGGGALVSHVKAENKTHGKGHCPMSVNSNNELSFLPFSWIPKMVQCFMQHNKALPLPVPTWRRAVTWCIVHH